MGDWQPARVKRPTVHIFADVLGGYGGIETYLDALARRLKADKWPIRVAVSLNGPAPFLDNLEALGIAVYRQSVVPGDRWQIRQRLLIRHVARHLRPGDWVYCVRQPMPEIYLSLVRSAHRKGAKVAASWMFAPEFLPPPLGRSGEAFKRAVHETDAVVSVSECTRDQFRDVYGHNGPVHVVRYHNLEVFQAPVSLPAAPPYSIGFLGRIDIHQKNLDTILAAFQTLVARRDDVRLNLHGGGPDLVRLKRMIADANLTDRVTLHGPYDHRCDLPTIVAANHIFIYLSRFEGGPCLSLVELLQAGRYVVASPVGGIPDIYHGRHQIGTLVSPNDAGAIAEALDRALKLIAAGAIDPTLIRAVYFENFSEEIAHRQFLFALGLDKPRVETNCP